MPSLAFLLLTVLLLSPPAFSWDEQYNPYGNSQNTYNTYNPYSQSDTYTSNPPPPRINSGGPGTAGSNYWNPSTVSPLDPVYGDLKTELQCSKKLYVTNQQIIDIQTSVQYGAQLLDGVYAQSFESCVNLCCQYTGCDLALYKTDGISQTGKTCYFVHCGLQDHCRMVPNKGFQAGFLLNELSYGEVLDSRTEETRPQFTQEPAYTEEPSVKPLPTEPPATSRTDTPTTETTPSETMTTVTTQQTGSTTPETERPDSMSTTSVPDSPDATTEKPAASKQLTPTDSSTADNSSSENVNHTQTTSGTSIPTTSSVGTTAPTATEQSTTGNIDDAKAAPKGKHTEDDCGKNGCDGSGLVAVTVIGTVIIVVLLVVAAVVVRRIYKIKTRKQYRNVDYLINGMYT